MVGILQQLIRLYQIIHQLVLVLGQLLDIYLFA